MKSNKIHHKSIDSTNSWAKQQAEMFPRDKLTIVTADEQTGGRGRFNRKWVSPPDQNIYASFCFFVKSYSKEIGNIPQLLSVTATHVLESYGFRPTIKWPNDVLINKKKVAGILAETTAVHDGVCVIIGIGINVNMPKEMLATIDRPATSLLAEKNVLFSCQDVLQNLIEEFSEDLENFFILGFSHFIEEYRKRIIEGVFSPIRFHDNSQIWEGEFDSIDNDGAFTLLMPDRTKRTFLVGEILWTK